MKTEDNIKKLKNKLDKFPSSKNYNKINQETRNGVYIVYDNNIPIYVGSTTNKNHKRLKDLTSHFSNHILYRKLLLINLKKKYPKIKNLGKNEKDLKKRGISISQYNQSRDIVEKEIKKFDISFFSMITETEKEIKNFEHFVIAVLNPKYNDIKCNQP